MVDGALGAAGTSAAAVGVAALGDSGVVYQGLAVLGEGAILSGLVFAAIGVFILEREWRKAAGFAAAGAVLTFFGFMHGPAVGLAVTPDVALAYALLAAGLYALGRQPAPAAAATPAPAE